MQFEERVELSLKLNDILVKAGQREMMGVQSSISLLLTYIIDNKLPYHNLEHTLDVLDKVKGCSVETIWAALAHDCVYVPGAKDNEENSAFLCLWIMSEYISHKQAQKIGRYILATKKHELSDDPNLQVLLDADLSILGSDWETYLTYTKKIREEFKIYPDYQFVEGRIQFLRSFQLRDKIFQSKQFIHLEETARENIRKELDLVSG